MSNRGNTYLPEASLNNLTSKQKLIFPNWDCKNTKTGGEVPPDTSGPPNGAPACYVGRPQHLQNMPPGAFPRVVADSYAG